MLKSGQQIQSYQDFCETVLSPHIPQLDEETGRLLHAVIGISTEAGELLDALKKALYYKQCLDLPNVEEEMGDILYYLAILANTLHVNLQYIMNQNEEKLKRRYPHGYTDHKAAHRDLDAESAIFGDELLSGVSPSPERRREDQSTTVIFVPPVELRCRNCRCMRLVEQEIITVHDLEKGTFLYCCTCGESIGPE